MQFEFSTANRIVFGPGVVQQSGPAAAAYGKKAFITLGRSQVGADDALLRSLAAAGLAWVIFPVDHEPEIDTLQAALELARQENCDVVIGYGGGSAMDLAKAVAGLATNPGEALDYVEVVGKGKQLEHPGLACIAVPTTAGTGAEVTRNAVLGVPEHSVKVSLRSAYLLPKLALVDPQLTVELPPEVTAASGLDALTQVIEPYVSNRANPLTDALCEQGIRRAARSLKQAYLQGDDMIAREDMALASLFGGLALANARLGAVHGFAAPLGGWLRAPHGAICARLLPGVMQANIAALRAGPAESQTLLRYQAVARWLTGDENAAPEEGAAWVASLAHELGIPALRVWGLQKDDIPMLVRKAKAASSMQGNPVELPVSELEKILAEAW